MSDTSRSDTPSAAEERLLRLLLLLQVESRGADAGLTGAVMRKVRVQQASRGVIRAIASLAVAVLDGIAVVLGPRRGSKKT